MRYTSFGKKPILVLTFLLILSIMNSVSAAEVLILSDYFSSYEQKSYDGISGPGIWIQHIGDDLGSVDAIYRVQSGNYIIEANGDRWVKSIAYYYTNLGGEYAGPSDYRVRLRLKIVNGEGGVVFRVNNGAPILPGFEDDDKLQYYLATVYKNTKKLALFYVDETKPPGSGVITQANLPSDLDLSDWFYLEVIVDGENITIVVYKVGFLGSATDRTEVIAVEDNRLSSGSIGIYSYGSSEILVSQVSWYMLEQVTTVTTTTTETTTKTETDTVTTTVTTEIIAEPTTITETITEEKTTTITEEKQLETTTETVTQTTTALTEKTNTVTATVTETEKAQQRSICPIAVAVGSSELADRADKLREFRDEFVLNTFAGEKFMNSFNRFYYSWSPTIANAEYDNPLFRDFVRVAILPLLSVLETSSYVAYNTPTNPEVSVLLAGMLTSSLIGVIYFSPFVTLAVILSERKLKRSVVIPSVCLLILLTTGLIGFALAELFVSTTLIIVSTVVITLSLLMLGAVTPVTLYPRMATFLKENTELKNLGKRIQYRF